MGDGRKKRKNRKASFTSIMAFGRLPIYSLVKKENASKIFLSSSVFHISRSSIFWGSKRFISSLQVWGHAWAAKVHSHTALGCLCLPLPSALHQTLQLGWGSWTPSTHPQSQRLPPDHCILASHVLLAAALHLADVGLGYLGLCLQVSHHWLLFQLVRERKINEDGVGKQTELQERLSTRPRRPG